MLNIATISVLPEIFGALAHGMPARAVAAKMLALHHLPLRDFATDAHRRVDDTPYGGGPGMVLKVAPARAAIQAAKAKLGCSTPVYYLSPQGRTVTQQDLQRMRSLPAMILFAGRYEGVDERLSEDFDDELSIGDYVLSGGELAAAVLIDAMARLLPGVLGDAQSAAQDSFTSDLLDHPHYTRPAAIDGQSVPEVLQNGDHAAIKQWRRMQALGRTQQRRPDLLKGRELSHHEQKLLNQYFESNQR